MGTTEALTAAAAKSGSSSSLYLIIIVVLFALLYFVLIRPQRNRQRAAMQAQKEIVPGQRVRTTAGMYATVVSLEDPDVVLEIAPGVRVKMMRRAIMDVVPDGSGDVGHDASHDVGHSDGQVDGSGPGKGDKGTAAEATEDGPATT